MDEPDSTSDPATRFGAQLRQLFASAGSPTLAAVAGGSRRVSGGRAEITVQRLSDWRRGRHLPARFETLEPALAWLILQSRARGEVDVPPLTRWREWWELGRAGGATAGRGAESSPPRGDTRVPGVRSPYRGLAALTAADRDVYFGRDAVLDDLRRLIVSASAHRETAPAIVVVTGVSGAGKSSLLRAGIARLSAAADAPWTVHTLLATDLAGESDPTATTGTTLADADTDSDVHTETETDAVTDAGASPGLTVHVVDQLEQVLVGYPRHSAEVARLAERLGALAAVRGHVVVAGIRADMYEISSGLEPLASAWQRHSLIVPAMTDRELEDVIAAPARRSGIRVDRGLAATILSDLRSMTPLRGSTDDRAGQLPLVAHVLSVMWAQRGGGMLTVAGYHAAGGVASAIAATAEKTWDTLDDNQQVVAERLLLALVHVSDRSVTRMPRTLDELADAGKDRDTTLAVIEALAGSRLVTIAGEQVQIIHDIVLTAWPRLGELIERHRDLAPILERVASDAREWQLSGRDPSMLYNLRRWMWAAQVAEDAMLPASAQEFLDAADRQIESQRRRRRKGIAAVVLLLVVALVAATVAIISNIALAREGDNARFSALLSTIGRLEQSDPGVAAGLAVGAWRIRPDDPLAAMRVLQTQQLPLPAAARQAHSGAIYDIAATSSGLLATASYDRTVRLWDAHDPRRITAAAPVLGGYDGFVTSVDFDPSGSRLASADGTGHVTVWDVHDRAHPVRIATMASPYGTGTSYILRYNSAGTLLASTHDNGVVTLWDTTGPGPYRAVGMIGGHEGAVRTVAISPTAPVLVAGSDDGTLTLSDIATPSAPQQLARIGDGVDSGWHSVAVSPDGRLLAAGRDDGTVAVWDISDPTRPRQVRRVHAHGAAIWSVGFSDQGRALITAGLDGLAKKWNVDDSTATPGVLTEIGEPMRTVGGAFFTARPLGPNTVLTAGGEGAVQAWDLPASPLPAHQLPITQTVVSRDGTTLATSGADQVVNLWDLRTATPTRLSSMRSQPRASGGYVAAFNRTGTVLATAFTGGGEVELYDITDRRSPVRTATLRLGTRHVFPLAFDPTRDLLVTGDTDNGLRVWDVADPRRPRQIGAPFDAATGFVEDVQFAPDGQSIAVADAAHRISRWDLTDPAAPRRIAQVDVHDGAVNTVAFSADGHYLYAGADNERMWVIDTATPDPATTDTATPDPATTDTDAAQALAVPVGGRVSSLSVSADGRTLVVGGSRTIQLWDNSDPGHPRPHAADESLTAASDFVRNASIDRNDTIYAGGSTDLRWWSIDPTAAADRVCRAGDGLDAATWREFAQGVPYRNPCPAN
ncbi:nSTAND1 domain-containing NTPase [Gordonia sp. NPDC003429]